MARFPIRFGRLGWLFVVTGCSRSGSYLDLDEERQLLHARLGWMFRADVPLASVRSAWRAPDSPLNIGVHGWRGRWIVNGAAGPMVTISIDPAARARVVGFPVSLSELRVSVDDPDALVAALSA